MRDRAVHSQLQTSAQGRRALIDWSRPAPEYGSLPNCLRPALEDRSIFQAMSTIRNTAQAVGHPLDSGEILWEEPESGRTGTDLLPFVGAALGGLLLTCSAIRTFYNRRIRSLESEIARLSDIAGRDHMTGLSNRRSFERRITMEWRRSARRNSHLTLALVDVDHFKAFNDSYGHPSGDLALQQIAECLNGMLERAGDCAFRIGGEEFALLLPDTDRAGAALIGERVCTAIQSIGLRHESSPMKCITVSFGSFSVAVNDRDQPHDILSYADQALYEAKRTGRNRVVCVDRRSPFCRAEMEESMTLT